MKSGHSLKVLHFLCIYVNYSLCTQVMHGGLFSEDDVRLDDIQKVDRNRQPPDSGD